MNPSDAELLQRYTQDGEEDAFEELVDRHGGLVFSICRRKLRDSDLAEDASQSVFATFVSKVGTLRPGPVDGFLAKLAIRTCKDICRSRSRRRAHEQRLQETFRLMHLPDEPDPRLGALNRALDQLRESYRDVVMLRYIEGMRAEAVASALGLSIHAVEKRLSRALATLREKIEAQGFAASPAILIGLLGRMRFRPPPEFASRIIESCRNAGPPVHRLLVRQPTLLHTGKLLLPTSVLVAMLGATLLPRSGPAASPAASIPVVPPEPAAPPKTVSVSPAVIEQVLHRRTPDLSSSGGLELALRMYSIWSGIPIEPRWQELKAAGIGPATPINHEFRNLTLAEALDRLLRAASPSGALRYEVERGGILIRAQVPVATTSTGR